MTDIMNSAPKNIDNQALVSKLRELHRNGKILTKVSNLFEDETFDVDEIIDAIDTKKIEYETRSLVTAALRNLANLHGFHQNDDCVCSSSNDLNPYLIVKRSREDTAAGILFVEKEDGSLALLDGYHRLFGRMAKGISSVDVWILKFDDLTEFIS